MTENCNPSYNLVTVMLGSCRNPQVAQTQNNLVMEERDRQEQEDPFIMGL